MKKQAFKITTVQRYKLVLVWISDMHECDVMEQNKPI